MASLKVLNLICTVALLAACEARLGKEADKGEAGQAIGNGDRTASAEGKAEKGQFSIHAPGFDMKIEIPSGVTSHGDSESDLLYPGSTLSGMHVEGSRGGGEGARNAGVELRFTTSDPLEKVASWYRDPERATGFTVANVRREGHVLVVAGAEKADGDPFILRLGPDTKGGTEGRLTLTDRS